MTINLLITEPLPTTAPIIDTTIDSTDPTCEPGDKECVKRWIESQNDCI